MLTGSISCIVTGRVDSIKEYIWDIIKLPISAIATDAFGNEMVVLPEKTLVSTGHHCEVGLDNQFIEIVIYFMERSVVTAVYDEEFTDIMEEIYLDE